MVYLGVIICANSCLNNTLVSGGNMVALEEHASKRDRLGRNYASLRPVDAFHLKHSL